MRNTLWNEVELWGGEGGSQGKWCFQAPEIQFFQNGLQSGVFFFFWNVGLSFSCGRTKTEAFQNDHSMHVIQRKVRDAIVFHSLYHFVWQGKNDWHKLSVYAYFFENGEKNSPLSNIFGYVWTWTRRNFHSVVYRDSLLSSTLSGLFCEAPTHRAPYS